MLSIGQLLLIVIPLILIAAVGCGLCWYFSGKKSYKKGYDTRKEEAENEAVQCFLQFIQEWRERDSSAKP